MQNLQYLRSEIEHMRRQIFRQRREIRDLEREKLLKKIQQAETASEIEGWANSPKLQPPK